MSTIATLTSGESGADSLTDINANFAALNADKIEQSIYATAANFYFEMDKDLNKALTNAQKATSASPKAFWLFLLQAKIEKELGDKVAAKASAEKCIAIATAAKNDDYVKQANDLIKSL